MRHFSTRRASSHKGPDFLSRLEALANFLGIKLTAFTVILFVCCGSGAPLDGRGQASCAQCVWTGIAVLERQLFRLLDQLSARHGGRLRVGLMTNQTGMDAAARRTV